jgi:hypothetical protein
MVREVGDHPQLGLWPTSLISLRPTETDANPHCVDTASRSSGT